jgi:hypothetical protein
MQGGAAGPARANHIWCLQLRPQELNSLLQLLCELDATTTAAVLTQSATTAIDSSDAAAGNTSNSPVSLMQQYLAGLLHYLRAAAATVTGRVSPDTAANHAVSQFEDLVELLAAGSSSQQFTSRPSSVSAALQQHFKLLLQDLPELLTCSTPGVRMLAGACMLLLLFPHGPSQSTGRCERLGSQHCLGRFASWTAASHPSVGVGLVLSAQEHTHLSAANVTGRYIYLILHI